MSDELAYEILNKIEQHHAQYMEIFARQDKRFAEQNKKFALQDKRFEEQDKRFAEQNKRFTEQDKRLDGHDKKLDKHEKMLNELIQISKEHTEDIKSIKRSLVLIEDAVNNKIPALFDAFMVSKQKDEELSTDIKKLEKTSDFHSLKISILEDTSKKHSEQLARLSS